MCNTFSGYDITLLQEHNSQKLAAKDVPPPPYKKNKHVLYKFPSRAGPPDIYVVLKCASHEKG